MTSKSPFTSEGIRAYAKFGQTPKKQLEQMIFDYGFVWPKHLINILAKVNFTYMRGTEWHAVNYDDKTVAGRDRSRMDMTESMFMVTKCQLIITAPTFASKVSRTGYNELI
jgi:hypothetical protein